MRQLIIVLSLVFPGLTFSAATKPVHQETPAQAREKNKAKILKAIGAQQFEKVLSFYPALEGSPDDQLEVIKAILDLGPAGLPEKYLRKFEDIVGAFRRNSDQASFDAMVSPEWRKTLTRVYLPKTPTPLDIKEEADGKEEKAARAAEQKPRPKVRNLEREMVDLVSSDGEKVTIARAAAKNSWCSTLLANALEYDPDALEVEIKAVDGQTLKTIVYFLNRVYQLLSKSNTDTSREITFGDMDELLLDLDSIGKHPTPFERLPTLINATHYLDAPILFMEFIGRYSTELRERHKKSGDEVKLVVDELQRQNFIKPILEAISLAYLFYFNVDLDRALGFANRVIPFRSNRLPGIEAFLSQVWNEDTIAQVEKDPNVILKDGSTPLTAVFQRDKPRLWTPLLKLKGVDVNKIDNNQYLPLTLAIMNRNMPAVRELLARGAAPEPAVAPLRDVPLELAANRHPDMLRLVLDAIAQQHDPKTRADYIRGVAGRVLGEALKAGNYRNAVILITAGADVAGLAQLGAETPYMSQVFGSTKKDKDDQITAYQELIDLAQKRGHVQIAQTLEKLRKDEPLN